MNTAYSKIKTLFRDLFFNTSPVIHFAALAVAILLVFGLKIQDMNAKNIFDKMGIQQITHYTPYYPGLETLDTHEIFNPIYKNTKKILFIGASATDSIGCDATWGNPDETRTPKHNAHYTCSIPGQVNKILKERGITEWRAFNLARNGSPLVPMLYTYAKIMELKPELVIFGETFASYTAANAGSALLPSELYPVLDKVYGAPMTAETWKSFRQHISNVASKTPFLVPAVVKNSAQPANKNITQPDLSLNDLLTSIFFEIRSLNFIKAQPLPVKFYTNIRDFPEPPVVRVFSNPDPDLKYFQGFTLIQKNQEALGGQFYLYFAPQYDGRRNYAALDSFRKGLFAKYLHKHKIPYSVFTDMPLEPITETYDGTHQTVFGNHKIATAILKDLEAKSILKLETP